MVDLAVGADGDKGGVGGFSRGAVWILFLKVDGKVKSHQKINNNQGRFSGGLATDDRFGSAMAFLGDLDGDGIGDVAVGATGDQDGGLGHGAVWILFLASDGTVKSHQKISSIHGGFAGSLHDGDAFGRSLSCLGDLDQDGLVDLGVGAFGNDEDGPDRGAMWILDLPSEFQGTSQHHLKIGQGAAGFAAELDDGDRFGTSLSSVGDVNGDGVGDMAAGVLFDDGNGIERGAVWLLFLNSDRTVKSYQKIGDRRGGFTGALDDFDHFGRSVTSLGDLDGDGIGDLAVGANNDGDGGPGRGAVWVLFLDADGTVRNHQKISSTEGGVLGDLDDFDRFGVSVDLIGDLDLDGVSDLAVGASFDDDGVSPSHGAVWILFLRRDGTVKSHQKISSTEGAFSGFLDSVDQFGAALASPGDLNGDGVADLAVGAPGDDDGGVDHGAVWILFLERDGMVEAHQKISETIGGLSAELSDNEAFGKSMSSLGDFDGDGLLDLAVGADGEGRAWLLYLRNDGMVREHWQLTGDESAFSRGRDDPDRLGVSMTFLEDEGGNQGSGHLAMGASLTDQGGPNRGAVWMLFAGAPCGAGTVNAAAGLPTDVLFVNGSAGDSARIVMLEFGVPITISFQVPSLGPTLGEYVLWVW